LCLDLCLERLYPVFDFLAQAPGLGDQVLPTLSCSIQALLSGLVLLSPLLADLRTLILALDTTHTVIFIATVTAQLVIARTVVDVGKGDVVRYVALVLAVKAGKSETLIHGSWLTFRRLGRRERGNVRAGGGAWFV
jgi:hypothetical protein